MGWHICGSRSAAGIHTQVYMDVCDIHTYTHIYTYILTHQYVSHHLIRDESECTRIQQASCVRVPSRWDMCVHLKSRATCRLMAGRGNSLPRCAGSKRPESRTCACAASRRERRRYENNSIMVVLEIMLVVPGIVIVILEIVL